MRGCESGCSCAALPLVSLAFGCVSQPLDIGMAADQQMHTRQPESLLQSLQVAIENLQSSINQHQHKLNSAYSVDGPTLLKYAHKLAYTSFAPLKHEAGQPLPPNIRPPNPQDWQFRASQLHQFQAEWDAKHEKQQAQPLTVTHPEAAPQLPPNLQLPAGVKLPPMPAGWKPGMPIPGLEEMLLASTAAEPAAPLQSGAPGHQQQQELTQPVHTQKATEVAAVQAEPSAERPPQQAPVPVNALRPAPFIPDFVLNPELEAVEEDYSSSDYSEEEI